MTSIYEIKNCKESNLFDFLKGSIAKEYTVPEETGFQINGNIGSILNSSKDKLCEIQDGIMFNPTNLTDSNDTIIGRVHPMKKDWTVLEQKQPSTPLLYCNEQPLSELLSHYPNGVPNRILNPTCNMTINGVASPTLAGISLMGGNNPDMFNNPYNDIGHELNTYGHANANGTRALGQGKVSCQKLTEGHNVPPLKIDTNNNGAYVSNPHQSLVNAPLYQVGDWTNSNQFPDNFINTFNQHVGQECHVPNKPHHNPHNRPHS